MRQKYEENETLKKKVEEMYTFIKMENIFKKINDRHYGFTPKTMILIFCAREFDEASFFYKENMPPEIFFMIIGPSFKKFKKERILELKHCLRNLPDILSNQKEYGINLRLHQIKIIKDWMSQTNVHPFFGDKRIGKTFIVSYLVWHFINFSCYSVKEIAIISLGSKYIQKIKQNILHSFKLPLSNINKMGSDEIIIKKDNDLTCKKIMFYRGITDIKYKSFDPDFILIDEHDFTLPKNEDVRSLYMHFFNKLCIPVFMISSPFILE